MSKNKYYAVVKGRSPGLYHTWFGPFGAEVQVRGFPGAIFKGFETLPEAKAWFNQKSTSGTPVFTPNKQDVAKVSSPAIESSNDDDKVIIYTDGGCVGNPGPGGYGVVIKFKDNRKELSGGYRLTTNNRMELTACIVALQTLKKPSVAVLYSDSQYVVNGIMLGWAKKWRANNWMRNKKDKAENPDLWEQLLALTEQHQVEFRWVRGHAGNQENERCDQLSVEASQGSNLPIDHVYEGNRL